jgi:hypothetical protein
MAPSQAAGLLVSLPPAEQIDQDYRDAAHLAVLAAPFRHSKLTATKILGDPNNPVHFRDDATADELRAEIMKRIATLQDAGLIDLQALPAPDGETVRQVRRGGTIWSAWQFPSSARHADSLTLLRRLNSGEVPFEQNGTSRRTAAAAHAA